MGKKGIFIVVIVVLLVSLGTNFYLWTTNQQLRSATKREKEYQASIIKYPHISRRVLQDLPIDVLINFLPLRTKLREKVVEYNDNLAIYFEYLPTGISIGIHEKDEFYAASLFKLPVVMAYFRGKERNDIDSDKKVKLTKDTIDDRFGNLWMKGEGYEIGLEEAAKLALVESDNTAAKALGPYITEQNFKDVYDAVDIDLHITDKGAVMTPKHYSSILKSLYFTSVLNNENSETILSYLIMSAFKDKLVAGVPEEIEVAHKIGVIDENSYMDCGIVYVSRRQHILCMVSKGTEDEARTRMSTVSKIVYDYVSKTHNPSGHSQK